MTLDAALGSHGAADAKEQSDLVRMREFARSLQRPFARDQWPAHFTGSAVVATADGARVLLLLHGKLNRWLQPGGHAEEADLGSILATATREAREETGLAVELHPTAPRPLDVDIHTIPARKAEPAHEHLDVRFLFVAKNPEALKHDPNESGGARWLTWDEALQNADEPALVRLLTRARKAMGA